jgi:DNA-binding NarL/FixJ family response regulator
MRVVLVGSPDDRARLRRALADAGISVAGEAPTLAAARAVAPDADAIVLTAPDPPLAIEAADVEAHAAAEPLTPREGEVLELLAEGLPNKAIAARLAISDQTVKFHVSSICGKLGASNRTDAVRRGVRRGILTL